MTCVKITFINKIAATYLQIKNIPAKKLNKYLLLQTPPALGSKLTFSKLDRIFTMCVFPDKAIPLSNTGEQIVRASIEGQKFTYTSSLSRYIIIII